MCQDVEACAKRSEEHIDCAITDLQEAENWWTKDMQEFLRSDPTFPTWSRQFGLFPDDEGVWQCGGRLTRAQLPFAIRHPVLLDQ